jgi:hypothetical protein
MSRSESFANAPLLLCYFPFSLRFHLIDGGYRIPVPPPAARRPGAGNAVVAKPGAFGQRKMDADYMEEREKARSKGRIAAAAARDGKGLLGGMKKLFASIKGSEKEEADVGMSSIQVSASPSPSFIYRSVSSPPLLCHLRVL